MTGEDGEVGAGFQTDSGLRRHARHLRELSEMVREAADITRSASVPGDAYGKYCRGFPVMLRTVEQSAVAALYRAAAATEASAAAIQATADAYQDMDRDFGPSAGASE